MLKVSFSIVFSPMIDVYMCIKVKPYALLRLLFKFNHKIILNFFKNKILITNIKVRIWNYDDFSQII